MNNKWYEKSDYKAEESIEEWIINLVKNRIDTKIIFDNPGGGKSTIVDVSDTQIVYKRGNSRLYLKLVEIASVYRIFNGKRCYTNDLKEMNPKVFSSKDNGHSCHCTFIFLILDYLNLTKSGICGKGRVGNPFYVDILEFRY